MEGMNEKLNYYSIFVWSKNPFGSAGTWTSVISGFDFLTEAGTPG
jgi:hypothetical protein